MCYTNDVVNIKDLDKVQDARGSHTQEERHFVIREWSHHVSPLRLRSLSPVTKSAAELPCTVKFRVTIQGLGFRV